MGNEKSFKLIQMTGREGRLGKQTLLLYASHYPFLTSSSSRIICFHQKFHSFLFFVARKTEKSTVALTLSDPFFHSYTRPSLEEEVSVVCLLSLKSLSQSLPLISSNRSTWIRREGRVSKETTRRKAHGSRSKREGTPCESVMKVERKCSVSRCDESGRERKFTGRNSLSFSCVKESYEGTANQKLDGMIDSDDGYCALVAAVCE